MDATGNNSSSTTSWPPSTSGGAGPAAPVPPGARALHHLDCVYCWLDANDMRFVGWLQATYWGRFLQVGGDAGTDEEPDLPTGAFQLVTPAAGDRERHHAAAAGGGDGRGGGEGDAPPPRLPNEVQALIQARLPVLEYVRSQWVCRAWRERVRRPTESVVRERRRAAPTEVVLLEVFTLVRGGRGGGVTLALQEEEEVMEMASGLHWERDRRWWDTYTTVAPAPPAPLPDHAQHDDSSPTATAAAEEGGAAVGADTTRTRRTPPEPDPNPQSAAPSPWFRMDFAPPSPGSDLVAHHRGLLCYHAPVYAGPHHRVWDHRVWVCDPVMNQAVELPPHPAVRALPLPASPRFFHVLALRVDDDDQDDDRNQDDDAGARGRRTCTSSSSDGDGDGDCDGGVDGRRHFAVTALVQEDPTCARLEPWAHLIGGGGALSTVEYRSRARAWATLVSAAGPGTLAAHHVRRRRPPRTARFGLAATTAAGSDGASGRYMYVLVDWDTGGAGLQLHSRDECGARRCAAAAAEAAEDDDAYDRGLPPPQRRPRRAPRRQLMRLDLADPGAAGWTECWVRGLAALDRVCPDVLADPRGRLLLLGARHLVLEDRDAAAGDRTPCVWEVVAPPPAEAAEGAGGRWALREVASVGTAALAAGRAPLPAAAAWFCVDGDDERVYLRVKGEGQARLLVLEWSHAGGAWYWLPESPLVLAAAGGGFGPARERYEVVPLCPRTDGLGLAGAAWGDDDDNEEEEEEERPTVHVHLGIRFRYTPYRVGRQLFPCI